MKRALVYILFLVTSILFLSFDKGDDNAKLTLANLRCEFMLEPKGIDILKPRLSWEIESDERGTEQSAYQILVSSTLEKSNANVGDFWNSGKVVSPQSIHVIYAGSTLKSGTSCYWKVKTFTNNGESGWSKPASWTMGLINANDWKAKWIGLDRAFAWDTITKMARLSARYFRKEFAASKKVRKATAYISGLGLYEFFINGNRIGDQVYAPVPTDYSKTVKYNTFDITDKIINGSNALAVVLGNGRFYTMRQQYKPHKWHNFGYPKLLLQVEIEYADGSKTTVISDDTWRVTADGPIRTNNEYDGEEYDATKELTGWDKPGYNTSKWLKVQLVKAPGGNVESQMTENMVVMERLKPVSINQLSNNVYVIDMGQNMAGRLQIHVKGNKGDRVKMKFAESLKANGEIYTDNLRDALVTDVYTLKGEGIETWAPAFVYHGFRFVEITGLKSKPSIDDFVGEVIYDKMRTTGSFETSDETINQVYKNAYWGIRGNYKGMPVDCPQRDERQPWLGDRFMGAYGESFIFDNANLYAKWLDDIEESQTAEGSIPDVAPSFWFYYKDGVTWPGTYLMVANMLHQQYGDVQGFTKHYPSMKKWVLYMKNKYLVNNIMTKDSYGDWCVPPESPTLIHAKDSSRITDPKLISTATYFHLLKVIRSFALMLGKTDDVKEYEQLSSKIQAAFIKSFYNRQQKYFGNNTVTSNILPLAFNLIPENEDQEVFRNIVNKTMVDNNGHISTGVIGTQWLMRWLTYYGRADIAYKLASNTGYPSWGYMAKNGATTIWELWNGNTANPRMNSQNHVMLLGDLIVWYYEHLAGIKSDSIQTGFKKIIMKPAFVKDLSFVNASYHSAHGVIKSAWRRNEKDISWSITIPANTSAEIAIPAPENAIFEGNVIASKAEGVKGLGKSSNSTTSNYQLSSGTYHFRFNYISGQLSSNTK